MLDARETAPAAATPQAFLDKQGNLDRDRSVNGAWSAGIPGLPAALVELSAKHGKLPLSASLQPAIRIAREGFPVASPAPARSTCATASRSPPAICSSSRNWRRRWNAWPPVASTASTGARPADCCWKA
ncbi:hypothetical protein G6F31_017810 [Rhizopus arrhizus]|nr:hypothetical protein G6F31_017810 [Rhizopus arrhizus]